ncbi:cytochrome c biogenesis protein ResB [Hylemonella gracilis]|uniref:ResB family protein n=1 Tax=Hylemonella gracilis ATCC 19624 TaxID=887062 RepID=F3KS30_9BURK|nr:cytochrome c biogenesis protein ResB [Hylemonella gracilis]EGI77390.1 ResB family protein [Hylemonella gracilis ATCC 19624]
MELLASMRFAISLLTVICIASVIGTVLKQSEPYANYVNQFGPFWAEVFGKLHLYTVYSAWWFLLILAFLVVSTTLCIMRNTPKILTDLRTYKENIRAQALQAFRHRAQATLEEAPEAAARRMGAALAARGWKVKLQQREGAGWMIAAKAGAANKLGYLAAHSAIVMICLGGLFDGDLIVRAQMWLGDKTVYSGGGLVSEVAAQHRLSDRNPTFRGNLLVAEGTAADTAILTQPNGIVLQELPFAVELKKFIVEYYPTGMPRLFASEIIIHDKATGEARPARVEVNHPARYKGVEIYQSSFDDGGSSLKLRALPMDGVSAAFDLEGRVGDSTRLSRAAGMPGSSAEQLTLEYTGLRVINVENMAEAQAGAGKSGNAEAGVDVRKVDLGNPLSGLNQRLGAANKHDAPQTLRNVGPSISYKLRDAAGQAREFNNYMVPVDLGDGVPVFLWGLRDTPAEPFRYLRVPADAEGGSTDFFRLRAALADPSLRERAVRRYAARMVDANRPDLQAQLAASALRALTLFAGAEAPAQGQAPMGGLQAIADFMENQVPAADRERAGEMLMRILNGALFELLQTARERAHLAPLSTDARTQTWMAQAVIALGDAWFYPAPFVLQLNEFTQVQASVFQVARAPGKNVVYLGCALLIIGIFAMLYVRERRLWVWLVPAVGAAAADGRVGSQATLALSTNRETLDADKEFEQLRDRLLGKE